MRSVLILLCAALQTGVLGYMVFGRESVVSGGQRIHMATAPIDPRDPFRGDFVRLRYPLNNLNSAPARWVDTEKIPPKGAIIYAVLEQKPSGLFEVSHFTDRRPENGIFMRGRKSTHSRAGGNRAGDVRFGIEQLFVEQGSGIDIENKRGIRGGMQTAMEVEIAIDKKGTAIITDYRWSPLAIQIELTEHFRLQRDNSSAETAVNRKPALIATVKNVSDKSITLNNPGDNCGFTLEPANRDSVLSGAANSCSDTSTVAPLTLASGQSHLIEINLHEPRWHVIQDGQAEAADLRSFTSVNEMMRIVYRGSDSSADNATGVEFWKGDLLSQGFNSRGRVD